MIAAPACPGCGHRLDDLPLDELDGGAEYACPKCGQVIRIPGQVLQRLLEQREALRAALEAEREPTWWDRLTAFFRRLFGG